MPGQEGNNCPQGGCLQRGLYITEAVINGVLLWSTEDTQLYTSSVDGGCTAGGCICVLCLIEQCSTHRGGFAFPLAWLRKRG